MEEKAHNLLQELTEYPGGVIAVAKRMNISRDTIYRVLKGKQRKRRIEVTIEAAKYILEQRNKQKEATQQLQALQQVA